MSSLIEEHSIDKGHVKRDFNPFAYRIYLTQQAHNVKTAINIGIKYGFSCINVCRVLRMMLKTEAEGLDFF